MPQIAGGCLCGKVRYSATWRACLRRCLPLHGLPEVHRQCVRHVVGVPKPAVKIEGNLAPYSKTGDTGKWTERKFCPECGSSIADEADALPDVVMLARARSTIRAG